MTSAERRRALRELEACVAKILAKGWTMECMETKDDTAEPFRAIIYLRHDGYDVETKGVM